MPAMSRSCSLSDRMLAQRASTMVSTWYSFTLPTRGPRLSREGGSVRAQAQPEYPLGPFKPGVPRRSLQGCGATCAEEKTQINKGLPILPEREVPSGYADLIPDTSQTCISSWMHLSTWLKHPTQDPQLETKECPRAGFSNFCVYHNLLKDSFKQNEPQIFTPPQIFRLKGSR